MATTPTWQAATTGQVPKAGQVNQYLGTHKAQVLYPSLRKANQSTAGTGSTQTNCLYIAQSFTSAVGQTQTGYLVITVNTTGGLTGLLPPTTVTLRPNNAGAPSATILGSTTVASEYVATGPATAVIPMPVTGLTASTTYWIVFSATGDSSHHFNWSKSNQVSGTSTSPDGVTWTAQTYGSLYEVWDQTISGIQPIITWEDDGAAWTWLDFAAGGTLSHIAEFTTGQTTTGYVQSYRTLTYSSSALTAVT
jgi:hypothetical protein